MILKLPLRCIYSFIMQYSAGPDCSGSGLKVMSRGVCWTLGEVNSHVIYASLLSGCLYNGQV